VLVLRDVAERRGLECRLSALAVTGDAAGRRSFEEAFLALTDGVTGLANRRAFDEALELEWLRAQRDRSHLSLLLLSLDGYRRLDDPSGRRVDDATLRVVATTVDAARRRAGDLAARFHGEDLALLLPNTPASGAARVADTLRANVAALGLPYTGSTLGGGRITASLGAVTVGSRRCDGMIGPAALAAAVGAALDQARSRGCSRLVAAQLVVAGENPE
jgi:diguanylate cyclase (GGDEF)-like protein